MPVENPARWAPRKHAGALTIALIVWLVTGLSAGERLPAVSWWLVVWAAETCAIVGYLVGRDNGNRAAARRIERDAREREDARERFARGQAEQVIKARQN